MVSQNYLQCHGIKNSQEPVNGTPNEVSRHYST